MVHTPTLQTFMRHLLWPMHMTVCHLARSAVHVLGFCRREFFAPLVPTPCHAASVCPIVVVAPRLGLLLCLLVPAGLPGHTHGSPHRRPDGCSLPGIAANGPANSPDGRAAAGAAQPP